MPNIRQKMPDAEVITDEHGAIIGLSANGDDIYLPRVIASGFFSHTGGTTEAYLKKIKLPAGVMGENGVLRVNLLCNYTANANSKTARVRLGGTEVVNLVGTTNGNMEIQKLVRNRGHQSLQAIHLSALIGSASSVAVTNTTVDTSKEVDIDITAQLQVGTDTLLVDYFIELLPAK